MASDLRRIRRRSKQAIEPLRTERRRWEDREAEEVEEAFMSCVKK
jgi:hypothetical protein